jgi:uncharacterized iron-regulated membrane protein
MATFKFFWTAHRWTGIVVAAVVVTSSVTGFMLLLKKRVDWIQPPTLQGAAGGVEDFITMPELLAVVYAQDNPDFSALDDIVRIDFRPDDRVFKVISKHHYAELQVCAVTGQVLSSGRRRSDLLEDIHDGSFWAGWWHDWAMPVFGVGLAFMTASGLWLWVEPTLRRRRRRRRGEGSGG